jgi:hypothetical protein
MDLAAFSQTSALGAHDPLIDSGMNSIRLTLATVVFDTNAAAVIATIAVVRMVLAFERGRRNGNLGGLARIALLKIRDGL